MSVWYGSFLVGLAAASASVMIRCDFRNRAGMICYLFVIGLIDAFGSIGWPEYIAAGILHMIFGATLIALSTRAIGSLIGVLSFAISGLCALSFLGFIPHERGAGIAFNINHWGMMIQWGQVAAFSALGMRGTFDRDLA